MKRFLETILFVATAFALSCSDSDSVDPPHEEPDDPADATYTLSADKTVIEAGETVTFTVVSSKGVDVTADCTFCSETACYAGNTHEFDVPGIFTIEAHYLVGHEDYPEGIAAENKVVISVGGDLSYTLSADQTTVTVGDTVYFTMTASTGADVTDQCVFSVKDEPIEGNAYTFGQTGIHSITALFMGDPAHPEGVANSNRVTVNVRQGEITYTLSVDNSEPKTYEPVYFTVTSSVGEEVTARFSIVDQTGQSYPYRFKSYAEPGVHTLRAVHNTQDVRSLNEVTVTVAERSTEVDPSRYYRRSVVAELTGTWCGQCPYLAASLDAASEELLHDRFLVVALHDPTTPSQQGALGAQFDRIFTAYSDIFFGQIPAYSIDWNTDYTSQRWSFSVGTHAPEVAAEVAQAQQVDPSPAGLALRTTLSGRTLTVDVEIAATESCDYYLGAALVEDNIVGFQNGGSDEYRHMNVGQGMITDAQQIAEPLGAIGTGERKTFRYTYTIPEYAHDHAIDPAQCRVVAWVCKASADSARARLGYLCSNAASCPAGGSADFRYEYADR